MHIQLIRNATLKVTYGGKTLLIDPYFADPHTQPSFGGRSPNPLVPLPIPVDEILRSVDYVFISHLHPDHFDEAARALLPRQLPVYCQPEDRETIRGFGFHHITTIDDEIRLNDVRLTRRRGQHGHGAFGELMGNASGLVLQHPLEPSIYWTGDTIWCDAVRQTIDNFRPEVIVCHAGGNRFFKEHPVFGEAFAEDSDPVIMDARQVLQLCRHATESTIIATHIGALDHETVTRRLLRQESITAGLDPLRLRIPLDGETIIL